MRGVVCGSAPWSRKSGTTCGSRRFNGLYRAMQNKRADPMLYAGAGLVAAMGAVASLILSNDI